MSQLHALLQSLNKCECVGLPREVGLCCNNAQAYLLSQLENTLHHDSDSMEFMRKSTQVYKLHEREQAELLTTVNDFVTGYCDALEHVNMTGAREVVDISSDEEGHNAHQETDENSFFNAVQQWMVVQQDHSDFMPEKKRQRTVISKETTMILRQWLFAHTTQPYPTEDEKATLSQQTGLSHAQINTWFTDARRRVLQPMMLTWQQQKTEEKKFPPQPNI